MIPIRLRNQLMTLNWESYIHFQESTLMLIGSVKGITTRPRTNFLPQKGWSRRNARVVPRRPLKIAATTVKTMLLRRAV